MAKENQEKVVEKRDYIDTVIEVKRVTKVTKGGKRFSFSAFVVSGNQSGRIGIGLGKGRDVSSAISKATARARKGMIEVALRGETLPYDVRGKHGAAHVIIRSAYKGTGVIAGKTMRAIFVALGVKDVLAKSIGPSKSGKNLVKATLNALAKCRTLKQLARLRDKSAEEIIKGSHAHA